jgi:transposase
MRWKPHVRFGRRAGETRQQKRRQGAPARSHLATDALEKVRRGHWRVLWDLGDKTTARKFKGARWALLKNPEDLTNTQAGVVIQIRRNGGEMWRAYQLKEALRAIFAGDLNKADTDELLHSWCSWAQRSRLEPFITAGRTIRQHHTGILAAISLGINNGRIEGLNNRVRLIVRRGYGFHTPTAALALVMLSCGPIELHLPHEQTPVRPHP